MLWPRCGSGGSGVEYPARAMVRFSVDSAGRGPGAGVGVSAGAACTVTPNAARITSVWSLSA